jgi:antitoxin HigA-1
MPMYDPPHPGRLVRENIEAYGLTVTGAARALGVTRQALNNVVNGRSGISAEMAVRLAAAFGSDADFWLRLQANYDLARVRKREVEIGARVRSLQATAAAYSGSC